MTLSFGANHALLYVMLCFCLCRLRGSTSHSRVHFVLHNCPALLAGISSLAGVVVIDVVEGTAIASLPYMTTVLQVGPSICT